MDSKVALITGASRGIGRAILLTLAKEGYNVIGTATSDAGANSIQELLSAEGLQGMGLCLRLQENEHIESAMKTLQQKNIIPSVLVNNAGITRDNLFLRMKDEEWNDVIATNLTGIFHLTQLCIKAMLKARFGRIVNISSVVGFMGSPGQVNYVTAKAGMVGFTKALAQEVASRNITVNAIAPGFIDTDMTGSLTEAQQTGIMQKIPMQRMGQAQDIADGVAFLVSDKANYITGTTLHINGGMYM